MAAMLSGSAYTSLQPDEASKSGRRHSANTARRRASQRCSCRHGSHTRCQFCLSALEPDKRLPITAVTMDQIRATALDLLSPKGVTIMIRGTPWPYIQSMPQTSYVSSFPPALDALCMAQLGTEVQDDRLIRCAVSKYFVAVRKLRHDLINVATTKDFPESLLAVPYILFCSGRFAPIAEATTGESDPSAHMRGLAHLLLIRQQPKTYLDFLLHDEYELVARRAGIEKTIRESCSICNSTNKDGKKLSVPEQVSRLFRLTVDTSSLLQRYKSLPQLSNAGLLYQTEADKVERQALSQKLEETETRIRVWLQDWQRDRHAEDAKPSYIIAPVHILPTYCSDLDATFAQLFGSVYVFANPQEAVIHARVWNTLLVIRGAKAKQSSEAFRQDSLDRGTMHADDLCRVTMYFLGCPKIGTQALMLASAIVLFAQVWYRNHDDAEKMQWCEIALQFIRSKGISTTW